MNEAQKNWIDNASYEDLLRKVRFARIGDEMFIGELGDYFIKVMREKRAEIGDAGHTTASKRIGW